LSRHQTLRSLIDWSYDLLSQSEKRLVQRLSVFAGGWTLEAAERVCADQGVAAEDVLDLLTSLAGKNLVVAHQNEGHSRYRFLETVRQYGIDRLEECMGGDAVRQRHRDYFLVLAEEAEPNLTGAHQTAWLQRLEEEHENLRVALDWSLVEEESDAALRLCGALQRFWWTRGHLFEGREWCARILGKVGAEERTAERAKVLNAAGALAYYQSDYPAAKARHEESLAIARELGDRASIARSLNNLGNVAIDQGDLATAQARHHEALAIRRELGAHAGIASSLCNLGLAILYQGDAASARAPFEDSLAIRRELGDRWGIAQSLNHLANVALAQGDLSIARAQLEESLAIMRELENTTAIASALSNLGAVALAQGDLASARSLCKESLAIGREVGARWEIVYALNRLASVADALGNPLRAASIWGAGERLRGEIGSPLPSSHRHEFDRSLAAARAALGDDAAFDRAWHEGHALTLEQAIELAMEEKSQRVSI
jgi:tetratricopeptide (TPR) repeat protein